MRTNVSVPLEIIEEIIVRLPAKALGRFKCVSKQWKTLISSVRFINNHIDSSSNLHREKVILLSDDRCLYTVDLLDLKDDTVEELMATKLESLPPVYGLDSSFNGLITARLDEERAIIVLVINPTTGESTVVVKAGVLEHENHDDDEVEVWGFGYDSSTDDYKSFCIIECKSENARGIRRVLVHSLRSNTLREDIKPPDTYTSSTYLNAVYLNGCLHWQCHRRSDSERIIASFNLQNEEFGEMRLAGFIEFRSSMVDTSLYVVSGCLCVVTKPNDYTMNLWLMKEYGVSESLKKISIRLDAHTAQPLYLLGDREVVLKVNTDEHYLVVYNLDEETERVVTISGIPTDFDIEGTCGQSLVSPKYVNRLE